MNDKHLHRLTVIPAILMGLLAITAHGAGPFAGGTGEPNDPFQIETAQQLMAIGGDPNLLGEHFILNNDIDMDPNGPGGRVVIDSVIGTSIVERHDNPFFGEFDGNYHVIRNLTIQRGDDECCGFTGYLEGVIRNLTLENVLISKATRGGAISGLNNGAIKNCHASGRVIGSEELGGLVGVNAGLVSHCTTHMEVVGESGHIGGLVGSNRQTIIHCASRGDISGSKDVGGLVGENGGRIIESQSDCNTVGDESVGGLVGGIRFVGGLILKCQTHGPVHGNTNVGGLIGRAHNSGMFSPTYISKNVASSSVHADQVAGGFIGYLDLDGGIISECYALGEVKADIAGGFIGSAFFYTLPGHSQYSFTDC